MGKLKGGLAKWVKSHPKQVAANRKKLGMTKPKKKK